MRPGWLGILVLMVAVCLASTARAQLENLRPIPAPVLTAVSEDVRALLEQQQQRVEVLASLEDTLPGDLALAFGTLGQLFFAYRFVDSAEASFANALDLNPADFRWAYFLGLLYLEERRLDLAATHFERVLEVRSDDQAARLRLAEVHLEAGDHGAARNAYTRVLEMDHSVAAALAGLGRVALAENRPAEAVPLLEAALDEQPEATRLHSLLARAQRRLGNEAEAARHAELNGPGEVVFSEDLLRELANVAESADFHVSTADRAAAAGRYDFAAATYRRALELDPEELRALQGLGAVLEQQGDLDGALDLYGRAIEIDPQNVFLHFALGRVHTQRGEMDAAVRRLEAAIALDERHEQAHLYLARALADTGAAERALEHLDRVLELNPQNRVAALERPRVLRQLGRAAEALSQLERSVADMPEDAVARLNLATALVDAGSSARARAELAVVVAGMDAGAGVRALAHYNLGLLDSQNGDIDGAIEELEAAVDLDPSLIVAHFQLATVLARLERYEEASRRYNDTLKLEPTHVPAHLAQATALVLGGRCAEARDRLLEGIRVLPEELSLPHTLARLLATCPDPGVRDGQRALELAEMVFRHSPTFEHGETISMAHAETGALDQAIRWQEGLVREAERIGDETWLERLRVNLETLRAELEGTSEGR